MAFRNRTKHLLLAAVVLCIVHSKSEGQSAFQRVKWSVEKNSALAIDGKSNINSFTCNVGMEAEKDTIIFTTNSAQRVILSGDIQIEVADFDCHSPMITKDLRKTLKSDQYPRMTIRFLSLQFMPLAQRNTESVRGIVEVELAGVVKRFELNYSFARINAGCIILNGSRAFSFADFRLTPPQKLGGLIKIKDAFDVNFQLILRTV